VVSLCFTVKSLAAAPSAGAAGAAGAAGTAGTAGTSRQVPAERYAGVVANETVTDAGNDFFRLFASAWSERPLSSRFTISIHERRSARWGNGIWIEYAQRRIFQASLPLLHAGIRQLSAQAAAIVYARVMDAEVGRLLFREPDLGSDEL